MEHFTGGCMIGGWRLLGVEEELCHFWKELAHSF